MGNKGGRGDWRRELKKGKTRNKRYVKGIRRERPTDTKTKGEKKEERKEEGRRNKWRKKGKRKGRETKR